MHSVQSSELDGCYAGACLCLTAFAPIPCIREEGNFRAWTSLCECICVNVYASVCCPKEPHCQADSVCGFALSVRNAAVCMHRA